MDLIKLKKEYEIIAKKHKLPDFNSLNTNFEIEKLDKETDSLARAIRKCMMEKVVNSLNFIEMLMNQVNAPKLYQAYISSITPEEKNKLNKIYQSLGNLSLLSLDLEIESNEKNESEVIKTIFDVWKKLQPDFKSVLNNIKNPPAFSLKKEKNYFG